MQTERSNKSQELRLIVYAMSHEVVVKREKRENHPQTPTKTVDWAPTDRDLSQPFITATSSPKTCLMIEQFDTVILYGSYVGSSMIKRYQRPHA